MRFVVYAWVCLAALASCAPLQYQTQIFRDKKYEKYYQAQKRANPRAAIIRYKPVEDDIKYYRYTLREGDEIEVRLLNVPAELRVEGVNLSGDKTYIVSADGYIILPLIGKIYVKGKTSDEVRKMVETELSVYYRDPFVDVVVKSMRIFLFTADMQRKIVLTSERMHLTEALAMGMGGGMAFMGGGLNRQVKVGKVKIIRGDPLDPQIIWVDMRKMEVMAEPDLMMRSGDIVYLENRNLPLFNAEAGTVFAAITAVNTLVSLYFLLRSLGIINFR